MIVDRYYYGKLPEHEKRIYLEVYRGCMNHKDIIPISIGEDRIKSYPRIIRAVMDDNPLMYYVNQSVCEIAQDTNGNSAVLPQYFFTPEIVAVYNQRLQNAVNRIIFDLKLTEGTDLEKARKIHDYLCSTIAYDYQGSDIGNISRFITAHNILGAFALKKAQCEGIAKAAKVLLNAVDVRCILVFGKAEGKDGVMTDHCWNIVNIEGHPYHMDITFDLGRSSEDFIAYDYYNITDAQIRKDHVFSGGLPKCKEIKANFFEQEKLIFTSNRKLERYIAQTISEGKRILYFKLAGKLKAEEIRTELLDYATTVLSGIAQGHTVEMTINKATGTCRIKILLTQ